jgi:hypothetical protein
MPDIGKTTIGGNTRALDDAARGLRIVMTEDAAAGVTITAYISDSATGDNFQAIVVDDTDKTTVIAYSDIRTDISTAGWYTFSGGNLSSYAPSNGTAIVIAALGDGAANALIYHDDTGLDAWIGVGVTSGTPPTLGGAMSSDAIRDYSIYMTYTAAGGDPEGSLIGGKLLGGGLLINGVLIQ